MWSLFCRCSNSEVVSLPQSSMVSATRGFCHLPSKNPNNSETKTTPGLTLPRKGDHRSRLSPLSPPTVFHKLNRIKLAVLPFASLAQNQWVHPALSFRTAVLLGGFVIYFTFFDQYMRCCFCFFFYRYKQYSLNILHKQFC